MDDHATAKEPGQHQDLAAILAAFEVQVEQYKKQIATLESEKNKSFWQRISGGVAAAALLLGLIATCDSIYTALVTDPEKARIDRLAQFDDTVNSLEKTSEDMQLSPYQDENPGEQYTVVSYSNSQIAIDTSAAEALLQEIPPSYVGIPQLLALMDGAFSEGDFPQAKVFLNIALNKTDDTPLEQAAAERYAGKYFFAVGDVPDARADYLKALDYPIGLGNAAVYLGDLTSYEISANDCGDAMTDMQAFAKVILNPQLSPIIRGQMLAKEHEVLQESGGSCPLNQYAALLPAQ